MSHTAQFLAEAKQVIDGLNIEAIERMASILAGDVMAAADYSSWGLAAVRPMRRTPSTTFARLSGLRHTPRPTMSPN